MRLLSAQMVQMNSMLMYFVMASKMCEFPFPRIHVTAFNATELLVASLFEEAFPVMATSRVRRLATPILCLCLTRKYGKSYLDTDVHFLAVEQQPAVCAAVRGRGPVEQQQERPRDHQRRLLPLADMLAFQLHRVLAAAGK